MSLATTTFSINAWPKGLQQVYNGVNLFGTITVAPGEYGANGIPLSFNSNVPGYNPTPFFALLQSPTTGIDYEFDPVNQTLRIYQNAVVPPAITTSAFAVSTGWGGSAYPPTLVLSSPSVQSAGSLTVETNASGSTGANPTVTFTFPQPYSAPPVVVVSRGVDSALTSGHWVVKDSSTTNNSVIFEFIGTPTAGDNYVVDWILQDVGTNAAAPVVAGSFATSGWGTSPTVALENSSSTQDAFSLSITAGATPSANPTVTLTFPVPYASPRIFSCSPGVADPTTGYWIFTGSTTNTASFAWIGTPTNTDVYILDAIAKSPASPAVTTAGFVLSSGWGTSPVVSVTGTQAAFTLTITAEASTGANPTVTLTFPTTLQNVSTFVVSRGDTYSGAGYWAVNDGDSTTNTLVIEFVGTPTATHTYILNAISELINRGPSELAVGSIVPVRVTTDTIYVNAATTKV